MKTRSDKCLNVGIRHELSETQEDDSDKDVAEEGKCQELVLRVVRDVGVGLGISITGGVGTTAFKRGDEVAFYGTLLLVAGWT